MPGIDKNKINVEVKNKMLWVSGKIAKAVSAGEDKKEQAKKIQVFLMKAGASLTQKALAILR